MQKLEFKYIERKKIDEKNDWMWKISKLIKRPMYLLYNMIGDWPLEIVKQSYLDVKSESEPEKQWWIWRKKFEQRPMNKKSITEMSDKDKIEMPCLECGKLKTVKIDSNEATGVFNVFCPGGECEDRYAAKL